MALPDTAGQLVSTFRYCDGTQPVYQLGLASRATVIDLATGGRRSDLSPSAYKITRSGSALAIAPQDVSFAPDGVVNPATLASGIAPGGLMTILGSGLAGPGGDTAVDVDGVAAQVVFQSPFRIHAQVPQDLAPGTHSMRVQSPYGSATQPVEVSAAAPAIYPGAVANQNGQMNGPLSAAVRGQSLTVYCTGLGAVIASGNLFRTQGAVSAVLNGVELGASFAGLSPGLIGLYQVNFSVPLAAAPGLELPLMLREFERDSNTVFIAVQ